MDKKPTQQITKCIFILFILIIGLYRPWIEIFKTLSSGDWPYLFPENIKEFSVFQPPFLWLDPYYRITAKIGVEYLSLSWEITEKIFWFYPFIIICVISSWIFISFCLKSFFKIERWLLPTLIGSLIYTTNTYILMIVGGGQMGVGMAYAIAPIVLLIILKLCALENFRRSNFQFSRLAAKRAIFNFQFLLKGLILAVQLMFDPRIFLLTLLAGLLFILFQFVALRHSGKPKAHPESPRQISDSGQARMTGTVLIQFVTLTGIAIILNLFWLLPNFDFYQTHYNDAVNQVELDFLSFASFSNSLSLLHPNWPENLFGKTYFLRAEFLLLPILAYSSLLFISEKRKAKSVKLQRKIQNFKNNLTILFFVFLGLLGTFLAKGVNPPFGEINTFLYNIIPGISLFRDPTKFYLLIVLSYSALIPYTILNIYNWTQSKREFLIFNFFASLRSGQFSIKSKNIFLKLKIIFFLFTIFYLLFLIRPAWSGQLGGTFKPKKVPEEYIALKEFIKKDSSYSSILWIPFHQRFGFASTMHPALDAQDTLGTLDSKEFVFAWKKDRIKQFFQEEKVRYVIIPYDSEKEIFLNDYKYSSLARTKAENIISSVSWLNKLEGFGRISVYEVKGL